MPETPDIREEFPLADVAAVLTETTLPLSEGETPENAKTAYVPVAAKGARNHA